MKMKIEKNKKMFLALAVVAALAMVSVAGIALQSDDSDAADGIVSPMGFSDKPTVISGTQQINYQFYLEQNVLMIEGIAVNIGYFEITAGSSVSGTISIGTYDETTGVYTANNTITLTNAGGVRLTMVAASSPDLGNVSFFMIGNMDQSATATPSGEFKVTKGNLVTGALAPGIYKLIQNAGGIIGNVDVDDVIALVTPFNGTVKAGDNLTVTSAYTLGTILTADGTFSGGAASPNEVMPKDAQGVLTIKDTQRTLSIGGTGKVAYPADVQNVLVMAQAVAPQLFVMDSVYVTIEDKATLTVGDNAPKMAQSVDILTNVTMNYGAGDFAYLVDSKGVVYNAKQGYDTNIRFVYLPLQNYNMVAFIGGEIYYGAVNISGSVSDYKVTLSSNKVLAPTAAITTDSMGLSINVDNNKVVNYDNTKYYYLSDTSCFVMNQTQGVLGKFTKTGEITFPTAVVNTDVLVVLMKDQANTRLCGYVGTVDNTNTVTGVLGVDTTSGVAVAASKIKAGPVNTTESVTAMVFVGRQLEVKGTVDVTYTSASVHGSFFNFGYIKITGDGEIKYGVEGADIPTVPSEILGGTMDAAYYYTNDGSGSSIKSTYHFTTLDKALANADNITLIGRHVILGEETFQGRTADSNVRITIASNGSLEIGQLDNETVVPPEDKTSGTLNITDKVKIVVLGADDTFKVVFGQAIFATSNSVVPEFEPRADTRVVSADKITYSDLATGLRLAPENSTITLFRPVGGTAVLVEDATVNKNVIFQDGGQNFTIPEKMTFTVSGTMNFNTIVTINGTLAVADGGKVTLDTAVSPLNGAINVAANGTLDVGKTSAATIVGGPVSSITVAGTMTLWTGAVTSNVFSVVGSVEVKPAATLTVNDVIYIGKEPTLLTDLNNTSSFKGIVTLGSADAVVVAYGNSTFAATNVNGAVDKSVFNAKGNVYATEYGNGNLKYLFAQALLDYELKGWYNNPSLIAPALNPNAANPVGGDNANIYGDFTPRMYKVTLSYNAGATWVLNGVGQGTSKDVMIAYGTDIKVSVDVIQGYSGTPVLKKVTSAGTSDYKAGDATKITEETEFTVTGINVAGDSGDDNDSLTLIEILLIIIVIVICIISIIVALRLLRS